MQDDIKKIREEMDGHVNKMIDIHGEVNSMGVIAAYKASKEYKDNMLKDFTQHKANYCTLYKTLQEIVNKSPTGTFSTAELANIKALDESIRTYEKMLIDLQKMFYPDPKAEKNINNNINKNNVENALFVTGIVIGTGVIAVSDYFVFKAVRQAIYGSIEQYTIMQNVASATISTLSVLTAAAVIIGIATIAFLNYHFPGGGREPEL